MWEPLRPYPFSRKRFLGELQGYLYATIDSAKKFAFTLSLADDFQSVVRAFHSIRGKFLRYEHSKDPQLIREILEQLNLGKADERRLLQQICDELQSTLPLSE